MRSGGADRGEQLGLAPGELAAALARLARGEVVAVPTETYYALAADARSPQALDRLFALKGRGARKPVSLLVEPAMVGDWVQVPSRARALMDEHWPGALTLALPSHRPGVDPRLVEAGCIGLRVSPHPVARALVAAFGYALTATSANPEGQPPSQTRQQVLSYYPEMVVLGDGPTPGGAASTLARITDTEITILRRGPISI